VRAQLGGPQRTRLGNSATIILILLRAGSATSSASTSLFPTSSPRLRAGIDTGQLGLNITKSFQWQSHGHGVRQAESNIFGARNHCAITEQNVLLNGATAYMNVLRDTAILDLRKNNIIVLEEQLRQTRDRFIVGEVTRTDVAQAESSLATARSDYFTAQANLQTSIATYRQVIGVQPTRLEPRGRLRVFFRTRLAARSTLRLPNIPKFKRQCMPWTRRPCRSSSSRGNCSDRQSRRERSAKL